MNTANGSTVHRAVGPVPIASSSTAPATKPTAVPSSARIAVDPVDAAVVRSTDSVPSATQKPCCTPLSEATATATAMATEPRALLRNQTDRRLAYLARNPAAPASPGACLRTAPSGSPYQRFRSASTSSGLALPEAISASASPAWAASAMDWACAASAAAARTSAGSPASFCW